MFLPCNGLKLIIRNHTITKNVVVDDVSSIIKNSSRLRKLKYWITKLASKSRKYKWAILGELSAKNLLRIEKKKIFWLFSYRRVYLIDNRMRTDLILRLKNAVLSKKKIDDRDMAILGLIEMCNLYKIFSVEKDVVKRMRKDLKEIIKKSPLLVEIEKTIKQVQAAIIVSAT